MKSLIRRLSFSCHFHFIIQISTINTAPLLCECGNYTGGTGIIKLGNNQIGVLCLSTKPGEKARGGQETGKERNGHTLEKIANVAWPSESAMHIRLGGETQEGMN